MADPALIQEQEEAHQELKDKWAIAQQYDAVVGQKRRFSEWATGKPSAQRYFPVGPVWEPLAVPDCFRNRVALMNDYEFCRAFVMGAAGYAVAAGALSNNYFRYTKVSTVAAASALCFFSMGMYWGMERGRMRIRGSIPNGRPLLPWMQGYKHDFVPRFMKQKSALRVQSEPGTVEALMSESEAR